MLYWIVLFALLWFSPGADASSEPAANVRQPTLDLEFFEDDDCREVEHADTLVALMHDLADLLDRVLFSPLASETAVDEAWAEFETWQSANFGVMAALAGHVFARPYCEPGKVAWMASECLLVLRSGENGAQEALKCAEALDEDFLTQMTPSVAAYTTRLHLIVRSPWPAFRLLDLLVRLHPESGSTRMGACQRFRNWRSDPDVFDWPWFKPLLGAAVDAATAAPELFDLRPEDGPLSRQYRARWIRVHGQLPGMRDAISFSDDVFDAYREHHYKAGCHLGVISCYALQVMLIHLRDVEGRLHRYIASVANLINLHAPFTHMVKTDWPVFRILHMASLLQRVSPSQVWSGGDGEPRAKPNAASVLVAGVDEGLTGLPPDTVVFVTGAWGLFSRYSRPVLDRWAKVVGSDSSTALIFLALDAKSLELCLHRRKVHCVDAPRRFGIEGVIAKYLALASISRAGFVSVWLDLDVYVVADPVRSVQAVLRSPKRPDLVFARHAASESMSPAVVIATGTTRSTELIMQYAQWLRENPYLLDHQGWDEFLENRCGDHSGGFDYQGRNITIKDDKGPSHSFMPKDSKVQPGVSYIAFGDEFGSGDGWFGDFSELALFHFWGADESQMQLFKTFYSNGSADIPTAAKNILAKYRREIVSAPRVPALVGSPDNRRVVGGGGRPLRLVAVSYADGCCEKALQKNRKMALEVGMDEAWSYGRSDLSPDWRAKNARVLSERKGGGWWLFKPRVVLQALKDPGVPWHRGVVVWVDAGNHMYKNPRKLITRALLESDVSALRLRACLESDWTSAVTLRKMNVSDRYALVDRPQIGAYFLIFRKTELTINFVEEWLRHCEDRETLLGAASMAAEEEGELPGFQTHQADQSVFSLLFKQKGFKALTLQDGHAVVKLDRWRE